MIAALDVRMDVPAVTGRSHPQPHSGGPARSSRWDLGMRPSEARPVHDVSPRLVTSLRT